MSHTNRMPIFNLKAVVQETGIKPDTLRAWERRYGIPAPTRTESGHRLYTQRDIEILKWLLQRQDEGLSISRAVALWQRLEKEIGDPLQVQGTAPVAGLVREPVRRAPETGSSTTHPEPAERIQALRDQWIAATLAFDEQAADMVLATAFGLFSPESVCIDLLQKGLAIIGEGWFQGRVTVQQEHFASALATRRLDSLLASTPPPTRVGRILVGCPPEESHIFVPLMLSLLLRRKGWNVIYLGADVPVESLEVTITTTRPDLVVLSAQQLHTVVGLTEMAAVLHKKQIPLGFGGLIFNRFSQLQRIIPGYFLGYELPEAIHAVEQIMAAPRPKPADESVPQHCAEAHAHFQEKRAQIEADVWMHLEHGNLPQHHLTVGNANFGRSIQAALALGNMNYLGSDMKWLQELLHNHYQMPRFVITEYLQAYSAAAHRHLDRAGTPLLEWLTHIAPPDGNHPGRPESGTVGSATNSKDADVPAPLSADGTRTGNLGTANADNTADPEHGTIDPNAMHQMPGPRQPDNHAIARGLPAHSQNTTVADGRLYRADGAQNSADSSNRGPGRSLHDGKTAGSSV
ncbi:MAG: MerR family transcriptional regulator [Litorilinea sp.]